VSIRRVFLTGGGGFVGKTLLRELQHIDNLEIVALDRSGALADAGNTRTTIVRGDLLEPDAYRQALSECHCVLHLAAATGKASAETHLRETATGTEALVRACQETGVSRLLLVSSIAAAFPDKRGYPYAVAKARAEHTVATSGLRYCVLRPTMVFGQGSPILESLTKLAMLPFVLVPGTGRARVQPVAVDDVVRAIISILSEDRFDAETLEVGGPEILSMESLLKRIRTSRTGQPGRALRVPLGLIQAPLLVAERLGLRAMLPATSGQLSSFRHDGTVNSSQRPDAIAPARSTLDSLLRTGPVADPLDHECRVFTRHLLGVDPDDAILRHYHSAIASLPALSTEHPWDRSLLALAHRGVIGVRCADAFAAWFARSSTLRKRLVMLLAILETRAPYSDRIDGAPGGPVSLTMARLALRGMWSMLHLIAGAVILVPMRLVLGGRVEPAR
jgi:NADH dehydrogenase